MPQCLAPRVLVRCLGGGGGGGLASSCWHVVQVHQRSSVADGKSGSLQEGWQPSFGVSDDPHPAKKRPSTSITRPAGHFLIPLRQGCL